MAEKKTTTTKKPASSTKKTTTSSKKTTSTKKATTSKTTPKKTNSSTKKKTTSKSTTSKSTPLKTQEKKNSTASKRKQTKPRVKKTTKQVKDEVLNKKAVEKVFEGKTERKRLGKLFYLIFSIVFFVGAFFYINNVLYDNQDYIQSAIFAFTALFVVFMLLNFNVHKIIFNFFVLPFKFLFAEANLEIHKDKIDDPTEEIKSKFSKYRAIFTLTLYSLILLLLMGSQIWNGILDEDKVLVIITQSLSTGFVFLIIVCLWQYLFNIIPSILENSIDAKNGYILTLSAFILIIYIVFIIFGIDYLAEMMIFLLILGFIALLGVNLNMIIGEFNIFNNLRNRRVQSKAVTRAVFMIFFSFHLYIILYASVVAYSIYNQNPDTYNFTNFSYDEEIVEGVKRWGLDEVTEVYDATGTQITTVYDTDGNEIEDFYVEGHYVTEYYDDNGDKITEFYLATDLMNPIQEVQIDNKVYFQPSSSFVTQDGEPFFVFYEGRLVGIDKVELPHTYGDMLYYSIITISSIGYGDISPNTNYALPQFWGAFMSIYGITFYALSIGYVSNIAFMGVTEKNEDE